MFPNQFFFHDVEIEYILPTNVFARSAHWQDESEPVDASSIRYIESRPLIFPKCPKLPHCSKLAAENIWLHI